MKRDVKKHAARAPRLPQKGETAPPAPWLAAVRSGLNGTAARSPDVARAVCGAVGRFLKANPTEKPLPEALTRAVAQYCASVVDAGLYPAVSPYAYLPAAIRGKDWTAREDRLEARAEALRGELARERARNKS